MAKKEMKEMSFMDHLEDLRWLLVRSTSAIIILACACYITDFNIFQVFLKKFILNFVLIYNKKIT